MGRKIIEENKKKIKISVSVSPDVVKYLKMKFINISSLSNKLLEEYIKNENKNL